MAGSVDPQHLVSKHMYVHPVTHLVSRSQLAHKLCVLFVRWNTSGVLLWLSAINTLSVALSRNTVFVHHLQFVVTAATQDY